MQPSILNRITRSVKMSLVALSLCAAPAVAGEGILNMTEDGIAMDGFNVMSYHLAYRPAKGDPEHWAEYRGATWLFASAENRDLFISDPQRYEPKYNGWCSKAVSDGYSADVDSVEGWAVVNGDLHLAWAESTMNKFLADQNVRRVRADDHWENTVRDGMGTDAVRWVRHADKFDVFPISHPQEMPDYRKH